MSEAHLEIKPNKIDAGYEIGGVVGGSVGITQNINSHGISSSSYQEGHLGSLSSSNSEYAAINSSGYHAGNSESLMVGRTEVLGSSNDVEITRHGIEINSEATVMGKTGRVHIDTSDIGHAIKNAGETVVNGIADGVNEGGEKIVELSHDVAENLSDAVNQVVGTAHRIGGGMHKVAGMINFGGVIQCANQVTRAVGHVGHNVVKHGPEVLEGAGKVAGGVLHVAGQVAHHAPQVLEGAAHVGGAVLEVAGEVAKIALK